jgi:hypothetical protein
MPDGTLFPPAPEHREAVIHHEGEQSAKPNKGRIQDLALLLVQNRTD